MNLAKLQQFISNQRKNDEIDVTYIVHKDDVYNDRNDIREVKACMGETKTFGIVEGASCVVDRCVDFIIRAEYLSDKPKAGQLIIAEGRTYEVASWDGDGCWRWSGNPGIAYRIHTQIIEG